MERNGNMAQGRCNNAHKMMRPVLGLERCLLKGMANDKRPRFHQYSADILTVSKHGQ